MIKLAYTAVGMANHYLQKLIIETLAHHDGLRFSELQPDGVENKLFNYHLKIVLNEGLVEKTESGMYMLSEKGRKLGVNVFRQEQHLMNAAYSVLFLAIQRPSDGAWLLGLRKTHPLKDQVGFMHAQPEAGSSIVEVAAATCLQKTGLQVSFSVLGGGFFRFIVDDSVESFTNFSLLVADSVAGELIQNDDNVEYFWRQNPDFSDSSFIANAQLLHELAVTRQPFFVDQTYQS